MSARQADGHVDAVASDEAWAIDMLARLIRVPSITGSEEPVQDVVAAMLREIGVEPVRIETEPAAVAADPDWPGA